MRRTSCLPRRPTRRWDRVCRSALPTQRSRRTGIDSTAVRVFMPLQTGIFAQSCVRRKRSVEQNWPAGQALARWRYGGGEREAGGQGGAAGERRRDRDRGGVGGDRLAAAGAAGAAAGRGAARGAGAARRRSTVRRDRWGVPHIEAGERWDMHFAQGFVHAQDRLWQMHFYQRVVSGRLSEFAGARHAAGRPADADAGDPARRRARGGGAGPGAAGAARALLRRGQRGRRGGQGAAVRDAPARPRVGAVDAGRHPQPRQAARLRPLDQLGARAAARRHGAGRSAPS